VPKRPVPRPCQLQVPDIPTKRASRGPELGSDLDSYHRAASTEDMALLPLSEQFVFASAHGGTVQGDAARQTPSTREEFFPFFALSLLPPSLPPSLLP
jgi:hypothetical protein